MYVEKYTNIKCGTNIIFVLGIYLSNEGRVSLYAREPQLTRKLLFKFK